MQSKTRQESVAARIRSVVQKRHHEVQQTFPDVQLNVQALSEKVAAVLGTHFPKGSTAAEFDPATTQFLDSLRWEELFLTTACAAGDGAAWKAFHLRYHAVIQKAGRCCAQNSSEAEELSESMMSALFLPISTASGKKTSKIAQYDGLGSLEGWLKVVVSRMAIDQVRRSQRLVSLEDLETEPDSLRSGESKTSSAEIDLPKASQMFLASLNHAMDQLDAQERLILGMYYLKDLNLKEIGRLLRVHESTVSRTLDRLKKQLRKSVEKHLRDHFRVRAAEVPQLIEMAHLEVEVDFKRVLTE